MKKSWLYLRCNSEVSKILRKMKITIFLLLTIILSGSAAESYSQSAKLTLDLKNSTIREILNNIEYQSEFRFFYSGSVDVERQTSISLKDEKISDVLDELFKGTDVKYEVRGRQIALVKGNDPVFFESIQVNQQQAVSGTVTDEFGKALPGVTVLIKGTRQGTVTNEEGRYSFIDFPANSILVFSFVGMRTQEVAVGNQSIINITLKDDAIGLEEVVAVGYGVQRKATLTGAINTVGQETFQDKGVVTNPLSALQGTIPGFSVTRSSGAPGRENFNFQIRGASSINGNEPLIVIDGIPMASNDGLRSINPDDIETVTILKDASASIYGARASDGVVLITTKRGKENQPIRTTYKGNVQFKVPGLLMKYMNLQQWTETFLGGFAMDGILAPAVFPEEVLEMFLNPSLRPSSGWYRNPDASSAIYDYTFFDTDWYDVLYGTGVSQMHNINISGSSNRSSFMVSLGYTNDGSTLQWGNDWNKKYNARLNNDIVLTNWLKMETNLSIEKNNNVSPSQSFNYDMPQPGFPASTIDGKPYSWETWRTPNWMAELGGDREEYRNRINASSKVYLDISKNLQFIGNAGINYWTQDTRSWTNRVNWYSYDGTHFNGALPSQNNSYRSFSFNEYVNYTGYVNYKKVLLVNHRFNLMAGTSYEKNLRGRFDAERKDMVSEQLHTLNMGSSASSTNNEARSHWAIGSYFGRFNYAFRDKYLVEANARYDGSSKFIGDSRWKFFSGISGGWRIIEEAFMKKQKFVTDLKFRSSWGQVGNQNGIGLYDYAQLLNINAWNNVTSTVPIFGVSNPIPAQTVNLSGMVSETRTWETVETLNSGLDFSLLRNKLSGSFDYFIKTNKNMLIGVTFPQVLGANAPTTNNGELKTWGWEFSLGWNDRISDFQYFVKANLSDSKNEIVKLGGLSPISLGTVTAREGYPMNSHFGWLWDGFIQTQEELAEYKSRIVAASGLTYSRLTMGDAKFKDLSGPDGAPDGRLNQYDAVYLGDAGLHYLYSASAGFSWKGIDVSAFFQGVAEHMINRAGYFRAPLIGWWLGQNQAFYNKTWTPDNPEAPLPRLSTVNNNYNYRISDWYLEDGSYLRLKNVVLGYTLPKALVNKVQLEKVRIYFSGTDLWEYQKIRSGWDPEAVNEPNARPNTTDNFGNDTGYPFNRGYSFGVDITF
jgi:TonB-linked SusC/RagA family outer membrane protein